MYVAPEIIDEKVSTLSPQKFGVIYGQQLLNNIDRLANKYALDENSSAALLKIARYGVLGLIFPSNLPKTLEQELLLPQETTAALSKDVLAVILSINPAMPTDFPIYIQTPQTQNISTVQPQPSIISVPPTIQQAPTATTNEAVAPAVLKFNPTVQSHREAMRQRFEKLLNQKDETVHLHQGKHFDQTQNIADTNTINENKKISTVQTAKPDVQDLYKVFESLTKTTAPDIPAIPTIIKSDKTTPKTVPPVINKNIASRPEVVEPVETKQSVDQNQKKGWLPEFSSSQDSKTLAQTQLPTTPKTTEQKPIDKPLEIYWKPVPSKIAEPKPIEQSELTQKFEVLIKKEIPKQEPPKNKGDALAEGNMIDLSQL